MKKVLSAVLSTAMLASMSVNAFAVTGNGVGTPADPFVNIPGATVNEVGELEFRHNAVEVSGDKQLFVGISSNEIELVYDANGNSSFVFTNAMSQPTKNKISAVLQAVVGTDAPGAIAEGEIGEGVQVTINNVKLDSPMYTFETGKEYEVRVSYVNETTDGEGNPVKETAEMRWVFEIPVVDVNAPTVKLSSINANITATEEGIVKVKSANAERVDLDVVFADEETGIANVTWTEYSDKDMTKMMLSQSINEGKEIAATELVGYASESGMNPNTNRPTSISIPLVYSGANHYIKCEVEDAMGLVSTHIIHVEGITNQNDETAPMAVVSGVIEDKDADGNVTKIQGNVVVKDAISNLSSVLVKQGTKEVANVEDLTTNEFTYSFEVKADDADKVFSVVAMDKGGNTSTTTLDVSEYFKNNKPAEKPGEAEKPEVKPDTTKPVVKVDAVKGTDKVDVKLTATDETALKAIDVKYSGSLSSIVKQDFAEGVKSTEAQFTVTKADKDKVVIVTVSDASGNVVTLSDTFASYFKEEVKEEAKEDITSNKKLSKLIEEPTVVYDDEETTVTFKLNTSKYTYKEGNLEYTIKKDGKKVKGGYGEVEKGVIEFTFEEDDHDAGTYELILEYENDETKKDYDASYEFEVEYREDSELANALTVEQEVVEDGKVVITLKLDEDKLKDADDTEWVLPDKSKDYGEEVEYEVTKAGKYTFKMELDDEDYKYTVEVKSVKAENDDADAESGSTVEAGSLYTGSNAPVPGSGKIDSITSTSMVIEIPMTNWDAKEWSVLQSSVPSNVSYTVEDNVIIFTVPNTTFDMSFKLVNTKGEYLPFNFPVKAVNADGSNQQTNANTGGTVVENNVVMALNDVPGRKEDELVDDSDIQ